MFNKFKFLGDHAKSAQHQQNQGIARNTHIIPILLKTAPAHIFCIFQPFLYLQKHQSILNAMNKFNHIIGRRTRPKSIDFQGFDT